jgi:hypothetical protein
MLSRAKRAPNPIRFFFERTNPSQGFFDISATQPSDDLLDIRYILTDDSFDEPLKDTNSMFAVHPIFARGTCAVGRQICTVAAK